MIHDKIGACLLEDPNKTIHKIFKGKEDELQISLSGEVQDLRYINIYNYGNKIDHPINDKLKDYVNYLSKVKGVKSTSEKMKVHFYIKTETFKK